MVEKQIKKQAMKAITEIKLLLNTDEWYKLTQLIPRFSEMNLTPRRYQDKINKLAEKQSKNEAINNHDEIMYLKHSVIPAVQFFWGWFEIYHKDQKIDAIPLGDFTRHLKIVKDAHRRVVSKWRDTIEELKNHIQISPAMQRMNQSSIHYAEEQIKYYDDAWKGIAEVFSGHFTDEEEENEIIQRNFISRGRVFTEVSQEQLNVGQVLINPLTTKNRINKTGLNIE